MLNLESFKAINKNHEVVTVKKEGKPLKINSKNLELIFKIIKSHKVIFIRKLVDKSKLTRSTVGKYVLHLEREGRVKRERDRMNRGNETTVIFIK